MGSDTPVEDERPWLARVFETTSGWTSAFVTDEIRALGTTATMRAIALVLVSPVAIIATLIPALALPLDGNPTPLTLAIALPICLMFALTPFVLRWTGSPNLAGAWILLAAVLATVCVVYKQQGLQSVIIVWFLAVPASAGLFLGARWTIAFSLISTVCIAGFWAIDVVPWLSYDPSLRAEEGPALVALNLISALAIISMLSLFWEHAAARLQAERDDFETRIRRSQKLETVGMLAGGIAHDFNNILSGILGQASMLAAESNDPSALTRASATRRIEAIAHSSRRAAILVEQMLAYAGRSRTSTGAIDLPKLVREVVGLVTPGLDKQTELILDLDRPAPRVTGDPVQIQQIAMNLVTNASEALEGRRGRVWIQTRAVDASGAEITRPATPSDFVMLEVRDEGCGIPAQKLERIFDPFFTTKPTGHGLGLAAVLGIVRSHGGDIEVDSVVGEGTRFRVMLRCPDPKTLAAAEHEDAPRPRIRLPTATDLSQMVGPPRRRLARPRAEGPTCVLVVDDEQMIRELAGEVLEGAGHSVLLGHDGDDGLRLFNAHVDTIDVVVLDRTMPGLDGLELLAKIRERRPDIPVIISSGYAQDEGSRQLSALGIDAILQKPWAPRDLVHLVGELGLSDGAAVDAAD
ncbi:hybrid sensor histidine kinase/response regulator [Enhygromyxa salina]|uniref:histidine kinase n=1 Tax=Enhygromyxa salina TaxID=215803 RepID=A0A2S9YRS0_9BACT|nr:ATP-binding protein [Enhygromyxa salina]PRQ07794.1 Blue-light-activated protein [Enhygromyxa salina]